MGRRAIICGGSIGGLFAATALLRAGWEVDVFERTEVELAGRGAGIVTHDILIQALETVGADVSDLGVRVDQRVAYDKSGRAVSTMRYPQVVTSWDRMHQILRRLVPEERYHLGRRVTGYEQDASGATVCFADGSSVRADLLVGADGFRSVIRSQMLPKVAPEYSGYFVWRALAQEADLPSDIRRDIFPNFAIFAPAGTQIVGYPIAGNDNDLRPGYRRYNFVWYVPTSSSEFRDMLTDATGRRHHLSIPPPLVREDILEAMQKKAEITLPEPFVTILKHSERPFFTPIYDHHSPVMHDGRIVLSGDAACVARPHVGMGATKAAEDALSLARHAIGNLAAYSEERVPAALKAHRRARRLGTWIVAPDPGNPDGASNPRLAKIMAMTAIIPN